MFTNKTFYKIVYYCLYFAICLTYHIKIVFDMDI